MWLLNGMRLLDAGGQLIEAARVLRHILGPESFQDLDVLVAARAPLLEGNIRKRSTNCV